MTIPTNLTHAEVGAYLIAIGTHMVDHDVCADAVLDPELLKDEEYARRLAVSMQDAEPFDEIQGTRALEILTTLTLAEAIAFNEADK